MLSLKRKKLISVFLVIAFVFQSSIITLADNSVEKYTYEYLNKMELIADQARQLYWRGQYEKAVKIFKKLSSENHPSRILYLNELGNSYIAYGDYGGAEESLKKASMLLETFYNKTLEERALSKFGKEEEKIYHGSPYERATSLLLLSLLFLDMGDYDNALAAIKNAILADSDATENRYDSDYTLLHLLEAKIHQLRGEEDEFIKHRDIATESYRITHPGVRDLFSDRLDLITLLKMPPDEREKVGVKDSDEELKKKISVMDEKLRIEARKIDAAGALGALYTGKYNTLIVVPTGRSPYKTTKGRDAHIVVFREFDIPVQPVKISLDGNLLSTAPVKNVADIEFQATTRGGRRMDAILKGKAAFRSTTVGLGTFLTDISDDVGGVVGLGMMVVGLISQGIGGAVSPEADTRAWETLPGSFEVYPFNLEEGEHVITFKQKLYFETIRTIERKIKINGSEDFAVVFGPPSLVGLYSPQCEHGIKLTKRDLKDRKKEGMKIIITPPLGLNRIERFIPKDKDDEVEACAPDAKRIMKKIKRALKKKKIHAYLVAHDEIINSYDSFCSKGQIALQIVLKRLEKEKVDRQKVYHAVFDISLIDTQTGIKIYYNQVVGTYSNKKAKPNKGFYKCLEDALNKIMSSGKFLQALNNKTPDLTVKKM